MNFIKPKPLSIGDSVAIVSPSWGGPSRFPWVYEKGLDTLRELGLKIEEYPSAKSPDSYLYKHPKNRAEDINNAFANKNIKAIIASIGGDDSVRILPFLDKKIAIANPKILMGFSDTTILTTFYNYNGLITFNGPSIMAGFAQAKELGKLYEEHLKDFLFGTKSLNQYQYAPYSFYSEGYPDWSKKINANKINEQINDKGWHWLQGQGIKQGKLFGGCIEVLEFIKGTRFWFKDDFWKDTIFFLETSEEKPGLNQIKYILRNYGSQGIFNKINALIFGRARNYSRQEKLELDRLVIQVVRHEFGNKQIPIITNMDFGHTDPQIILPLGIKAKLNCKKKTFNLIEPIYQ